MMASHSRGYKMKVGLLAGSFDIIHPGYIKMFKDAKRVCDYLIVALHEDPSQDRPHTKIKPVHTSDEREEILLSIKYVDEIIRYQTEEDLYLILERLNIDFYIIGDDYKNKRYTGEDLNLPVYFHKRDHNYSTTNLKKKIAENYNEFISANTDTCM
jgi:glycerol-3-phosphate cytidylyltransferase